MKKIAWPALFVLLLAACGSPATAETIGTVNPYIAVEQAQRTAEAAQQEADYFGGMLTATAEAPIIAITQAAASLELQLTSSAATSQAYGTGTAVSGTSTALSWTPTPTFTPTPNATATMYFAEVHATTTALNNVSELDNMRVERARTSNLFWAVIAPILIMVGLLALAYFGITLSRSLRHKVVQRDPSGDAPLLLDIVDGVITDQDADPNFRASPPKSLVSRAVEQWLGLPPELPAVTAERQDKVKANDQMIDRDVRVSAVLRKLPARGTLPPQLPPPMIIPAPAVEEFTLPDWNMVRNWDGKGGIPYMTAEGMKLIDVNIYPHMGVLGMTGARKSRGFIRPLIACALALGDRVVVVGKGADFVPFENQPNTSIIRVSKFTRPEEAERYCKILESIVDEMNRRDDVLTANRISTWTRAGHARTWIILDELGNALSMMLTMKNGLGNRARAFVEGLVNEGRKVGFNVVFANQRATGMASILSQTGKAIFRVENEEAGRHKTLTGANMLAEGYYFARFGRSELAGAFEPSDSELSAFLRERQIKPLDPEDWIDGKLVEPAMLEDKEIIPSDSPIHAEEDRAMAEETIRILDFAREGKSTSEIVKQIWGQTGGSSWYAKKSQVEKAIRENPSTSSAQNHGFQPV